MAKKQKHEHHEEHVDESWLIPYADLLTLLLALFIVLFATSQVDQKKLEQLSNAMHGAFNGGKGFFEFFGVKEPTKDADPDSKRKTREDSQGAERNAAGTDNITAEAIAQQLAQALQNQEAQSEQEMSEQAKQERENLETLKEKLDQYINTNGLDTQLDTTLGEHYVMITIRDQALYASGSATVKPEAKVLAGAISDILVSYPDYQVTVSGHTDNIPITSKTFESNWDLSSARSLNFMKELFRNPKVNQQRFSSTGFGEFHPIATNDTSEGRAQNRRVEVSIFSPGFVSSKQLSTSTH
ncbi:flagellar motor protein MotB [Gorillibacterium sp. sgz5001074]|uniref:flagellar motor protein MotB n=1 Tax=Gorillibacterium sp. sgz5001074 TaxID=3446695 RepID=UPI003F66B034